MEMGILSQADVDRLEKEVDAEIEAAIQTVRDLPSRPDSGPFVGLAIDGI
jgi:hypothetical protein